MSLIDIISEFERYGLNVFITSRSEKDIEKAFSEKPSLRMEEDCVLQDIASHVNWSLVQEDFVDLGDEIKIEIRETIIQKCQGM